MDAGVVEPVEVLGPTIVLDETVRRAHAIEVGGETLERVESLFDACRPAVAAFFDVPLTGREGTGLLRYRAGDFYRPHRDRAERSSWPDAARRRLSIVLFLSSCREVDPTGLFSGGVLRLYPPGENPEDVQPREGMLVVFPSDVLHEVTEVSDGVRDVAVDWYY